MSTSEILDAIHRRPFVPFRLLVSDGTQHEVRHPELVHVGIASVMIVIPHPDNPLLYSRSEIIDARHIVKLIIDTPTAPES